MMLMFSKTGNRLIIGLTSGNLEKLQAGRPATLTGPYPMTVQEIYVIYGQDKPDIVRQLEAAGIEIPDVMKAVAQRDPS